MLFDFSSMDKEEWANKFIEWLGGIISGSNMPLDGQWDADIEKK